MKDGDFVHIDYTGRIKEGGMIFDTTREDVARSGNVYNPKVKYSPIPVIIGGNFIFKGLEDEIRGMGVGEQKTIELPADRAFGGRRGDMVRLMPLSEFRDKDAEAAVGKAVNVNGITGRITSISGGRVSVDFNHPLAGKDLVYELEVKDIIDTAEKKVRAIAGYFSGSEDSVAGVSIRGKTARITLVKDSHLHPDAKSQTAETARKWVDAFESVEFVDVY